MKPISIRESAAAADVGGFRGLGFSREEATVLAMRTDLMGRMRAMIEDRQWTQEKASTELGIAQSRVSDLVRGKWKKFSLDMLLILAARAGLRPELNLEPPQNLRAIIEKGMASGAPQAVDAATWKAKRGALKAPKTGVEKTLNRIGLSRVELDRFCSENGITRLSFFGSVTRDDYRKGSDVDVLLEFAPGRTPSLFGFSDLRDELSRLIGGEPVDLASPRILDNIHRRRVIKRDLQLAYEA